jgi:hypothetical protein
MQYELFKVIYLNVQILNLESSFSYFLSYNSKMTQKILFYIALSILTSCASKVVEIPPLGLNITEINPNKWTAMMKQNMFHLAQVYDLSGFLYSKNIFVESMVTPRSHPVLTLNTRYAERPHKILSSWLHEEFHWWMDQNPKKTKLAINELKISFPNSPNGIELNADSTFLHLIVCYLELKALSFYLGEKEARLIIEEMMNKDKLYPWIYYQVLYKDLAIKQVIKKYKLLPAPLTH